MSINNNSCILAVRERFPWMGLHSGYDLIFPALQELHPDMISVWRNRIQNNSLRYRVASSFFRSIIGKGPLYDISSFSCELNVVRQVWRHKPSLVHMAYVEENLGLLTRFKNINKYKMIGTIHQSLDWWKKSRGDPSVLNALDLVLALSSIQAKEFSSFAPGKVHFLQHGVDTKFFCPSSKQRRQPMSPPRILFCGRWMRDLETLREIVEIVLRQRPDIGFSLIIKADIKNSPALTALEKLPQVEFLSRLSDEELLEVYRTADVFLLPLLACTANNALLEAISCGLPIIATDVGGIRDYTHKDFAYLRPVGDSQGMANDLLELVESPEEWRTRSERARNFAVNHLDWSFIARKTSELYPKTSNKPA